MPLFQPSVRERRGGEERTRMGWDLGPWRPYLLRWGRLYVLLADAPGRLTLPSASRILDTSAKEPPAL